MKSAMLSSLLVASALLVPAGARAQSLLDRPPNISGDWTGSPGTLYFHFVHRFSTSGAPERKVTNVPTFLLAAGLPGRFLAGLNYSTNSQLKPGFPNEWELFARWSPLQQDYGAPLDLGGQVGYNNAANGADAEVSVARRVGIARVIAAGRALSDPLRSGHVQYAIAGGGTLRLGPYVALAGDVGSLTSRDSSERVAWSAGVHFAIPLTPHTVSIQVTNTLVTTLQGVSRGTDKLRYGFEFTIPLTLLRFFGPRAQPAPVDTIATTATPPDSAGSVRAVTPEPAAALKSEALPKSEAPPTGVPAPTAAPRPPATAPRPPATVVRTGMKNTNYLQSRLQVTEGTTVEWTNNDPLAHTVTAVDKSFNSGLIQPGKKFRHTFTKTGTFNFYCTTHPFMKGAIVVKAP
jgi:plastocyanin